jgi:hypothetical protein
MTQEELIGENRAPGSMEEKMKREVRKADRMGHEKKKTHNGQQDERKRYHSWSMYKEEGEGEGEQQELTHIPTTALVEERRK